ncbi:MAG TPA: hypothetical protein VJS37_17120 [Terriglobales bacterium]|nr:hypothetical protein [Terriglobales bacterium]
MSIEEQAKPAKTQSSLEEVKRMVDDPAYARKVEAELEELEARIESAEEEEDRYEFVDVDLDSLSEDELKAQVELLDEQIEQAKQRAETNRRAVKLGLLKLANQAPRCAHLKNNGEPCRAPAMGQRQFCVFHTRTYDCETNHQRIKVGFLEDRASLQLVLKQIMEQVLTGRMQPQTCRVIAARDANRQWAC